MKVSSLLSTSLGAVLGLRLFVNKKVFAFGRDDLLSRESVIPNPFHDDELNRNLEWRRQSELKAVQYRTSIAEPAYMKLRKRLDDGEISADQFRYDLLAVKERVLLDMQIIMFGTAERHARRNYVCQLDTIAFNLESFVAKLYHFFFSRCYFLFALAHPTLFLLICWGGVCGEIYVYFLFFLAQR
eukprot:m.13651 g.13651  ORF g.13651 m.13651 type:complete len:185 (+) comp4180_c0_seq2:1-555(+)